MSSTKEMWATVEVYISGEHLKFEDYKIEYYSGKIKSFKRDKTYGILLNIRLDKDGYPIVNLWDGRKKYTVKLHRIVACTFIPNPLNLREINHINGIKTDYSIENLEWCTTSHNCKHAYGVLKRESMKGEKHGRSKLSDDDVLGIVKLLEENELSLKQIGEMYGVTDDNIDMIKVGRHWSHITNIQYTKRLHGSSELTEAEVLEIYNLAHSGQLTSKEIAKKLNKGVNLVNHIKNGHTWSAITGHKKYIAPNYKNKVQPEHCDNNNYIECITNANT